MEKLRKFLKDYQREIVLTAGFVLIFSLGFLLGRITGVYKSPPDIVIEEPQQQSKDNPTTAAIIPQDIQVTGSVTCAPNQIKGNINRKGERIYHMPKGAFYSRTQPEACFDTEEQARAAGFRRSSR
jgi:hypothetical protein